MDDVNKYRLHTAESETPHDLGGWFDGQGGTTGLTTAQQDRACGAVLGTAIGDALGAGYEFGSAPVGPQGPAMIGGGLGGFAPGEWTDDTTMAWCILDVAASEIDLRSADGLDQIARNFRAWFDSHPPDIGNQTRSVLRMAGKDPTGATMAAIAGDLHARTGHTAGNGSLMRTAPVALPYLHAPDALTEAAKTISALTHHDLQAQEACVLWSHAIRHAILHGEFNLRSGLRHLNANSRTFWVETIDKAETADPSSFSPNGWVITALQAAWAAIHQTPIPTDDPRRHLEDALTRVIEIGDDTDTTAAIAGALLGARWGASAFPAEWRRISHGYPGLSGEQLVGLAHLAANRRPGVYGWPTVPLIDYSMYDIGIDPVPHPFDEGVLLADAAALEALPEEVSAIVSLCLLGSEQVPTDVEHVAFRLIDRADSESNPHLDFTLRDAAAAITTLRAEGHTVLLHCVAAQSRTPTVAIAYAMSLGVQLDEARRSVLAALPAANPNRGFEAALRRLQGEDEA
ncbi:ADP-ribosylglycohydrolase family protein [Nocardioides dubius]|uniref:ADP-ribosylglycohydrolase family protein n=1 Tax=Nocardioides dubius TaxID=317019 RepID=A0ABN1TLH5_9ACTN